MLKVCALLVFLLAGQGQCQLFSEFDSSAPDDLYLRHYWNWRSNAGPGEIWPPRPARRDVEATTERDREPLGPDYKDREPLGPDYKDPEPLGDPDEIPGISDTGVIEVDANGFPIGFPGGFPDISDNSGFPSFGAKFPGFFNLFGSIRRRKPWWNGPNVCVEREETTEDDDDDEKKEGTEDDVEDSFLASINLSSCRETFNKYECVTKTNNRGVVKTFTVKYKCCYGYRRTPENPTCTKLELQSLLDTINDVGASEFRKMISSSGLDEKFSENNITVFVPRDEALNDFTEKMLEMNQVEIDIDPVKRRRRDLRHALSSRDLVLNHVVPGFVDLVDIENEQLLNSDYKNSTVRLNIYPTNSNERLLTANCVPIRKSNNLAENGIVHVIDGVITPGQYSIKEIIDESNKLSMLRKIMEKPELSKLLDRKSPFTLLAPTDEAFEKLDSATKQKLMRGDSCAINILKYHIIPHTICSSAINGNVTVHNVEGQLFNMERKENDDLIIEDNVKIIKQDIVATDGVIQLIDTLMLPESGLHVSQVLTRHNFTIFEQLIEEAGFVNEVDDLNNVTVFVPTNEALEEPETVKVLEDLKSDPEKLKDVLKYHILPGKVQSCDLNNNDLQETSLDGQKLRVNLYSTLPVFSNVINRGTVNCASLVNFDEKSCSSVLHTVDKLLIPPTKSLLEIVNTDDRYSILAKILKDTAVEEILKDEEDSVTLLAPTNEIFEKLDEKELNALLEDKFKANQVLKQHVLKEVLCCSGVGPQNWGFNRFVPTLAEQSKEISRNSRHQIRIGKATITKCDTIATNGILHEVNKVMFPSKNQYTIPGFGSLFMFEF